MPKSYSLESVSVTFHGKTDFADMIRLWSLKWEDYSRLSGGPNVIVNVYVGKWDCQIKKSIYDNRAEVGVISFVGRRGP